MNYNLKRQQLDKKLKKYKKLKDECPALGWVRAVRNALGLSLKQLGEIMNISAQSVGEIEKREREGTISLKSLDNAAKVFGLRLNYGFYNPDKNLEEFIEFKAKKLAIKIVMRAHKTMQLEDQDNSKRRLQKAIKEKTIELINNKPGILWD
jgi:predicted DNA-binding mobile mystery protein A